MHPPALKLELKTNSSLRPISVYCQEIETDFGLPLQSPPAMTYNMTFTEYEARITKFQSLCRKWLVRKDLRPDSDEREEVELTEAVAPPTVFEADTESDDEQEYHICGETGGYNDAPCCHKKVRADDTCMIGNTSYCIPCFEQYEEEEDECKNCSITITTENCWKDEWGDRSYDYCYECYEKIDAEEKEEYNQNSDVCDRCELQKLNEHILPQCRSCDQTRCEECPCNCYQNWLTDGCDPITKTVKELKAMCKAKGLKKYSKLKKDDVLRLLFNSQFPPMPTPPWANPWEQ